MSRSKKDGKHGGGHKIKYVPDACWGKIDRWGHPTKCDFYDFNMCKKCDNWKKCQYNRGQKMKFQRVVRKEIEKDYLKRKAPIVEKVLDND